MKKIEKLLVTPVHWIYAGVIVVTLFAGLIGGRGAVVLADLAFYTGFAVGCVVGLGRTIYLYFNYVESQECPEFSKRFIFWRRVLYLFLYYFILSPFFKYLDPHEWNNPYTYVQDGTINQYFNRDGRRAFPPTVISYKKANGHYYGLRMPVDTYKCGRRTTYAIADRRWYFILPFKEDAVIEFQNVEEFEAEIEARATDKVKPLDYALFDKELKIDSAKSGIRNGSKCVITRGL